MHRYIGARLQELAGHAAVTLYRGLVQRGLLDLARGVDVGARLKELAHHDAKTLARNLVQRGPPVFVRGVNIGEFLKKIVGMCRTWMSSSIFRGK